MADKWIKRWKIPKSNGNGFWTIAIDKNGNYGCSCPVWIYRRLECHHIIQVKRNGGQEIELRPKPKYVLAMVNKPIYKEETNELLIPLIKIPDAEMMEATVCYYLFKHGYSWKEVKEIRGHIPNDWTKTAIINHVEKYGEVCYKDLRKEM